MTTRLRAFTLDERVRFVLAAARVRDEVDRELGLLLLAVARGDDSALAAVSDRLLEMGDDVRAERVRRLVESLTETDL